MTRHLPGQYYINRNNVKNLVKLEELAMFVAGAVAFNYLSFSWWWFTFLFLVPDLGMMGYFFGNKTGAAVYNFFHHKGVAVAIGIAGLFFVNEILQLAGIILFSHSSFDRMLGYGLKYEKGFIFTHLGRIGKKDVAPEI